MGKAREQLLEEKDRKELPSILMGLFLELVEQILGLYLLKQVLLAEVLVVVLDFLEKLLEPVEVGEKVDYLVLVEDSWELSRR